MNTVRITYFGMDGEGATLTKAKQDAGRKIEAALAGSWTPEMLVWRGNAILVYREVSGWHNRVIADSKDGLRCGPVWGSGSYGTKKDAVKYSVSHLLDLGTTAADGLEVHQDFPYELTREQVAEHAYKQKFQIRYVAAKARGLNPHEAHAYAGKDPSRPDLWLHEEMKTS